MADALFPNGLGGTIDELAVNAPFFGRDCVVWYVKSTTGADAAAPAGRDKEVPLATLSQAVTNASANDIIVLLDGHSETIASTLTISKRGLVVVGCGQTSGVPNVAIGSNVGSNGSTIVLTGQNIQLRNLKFTTSAQANTGARIDIQHEGCTIDGCYFECNTNDDGPAVSLASGADHLTVIGTTFISTATSSATRPESALKSAAAVNGLKLDGAVFSDGTNGWSNIYALDLSGGAVTDGMFNSVSLLLGASCKLGSSFTGYMIPTQTGGGVIE